MNAPDGTPTNAVFGFVAMLLKFIDICASRRHRVRLRCRAARSSAPRRSSSTRPSVLPWTTGLKAQFPIIEELLEAMSIPGCARDGLGGRRHPGHRVPARDEALGYRTLLVSGDKDVYQLRQRAHARRHHASKGITDVAIYGPGEVRERYGVDACAVPRFPGAEGRQRPTTSPACPGVGDKTAAKLLGAYGSLEGIYEHIDELRRQAEGAHRRTTATRRSPAARWRPSCATSISRSDLEGAAFPSFDARRRVTEAFSEVSASMRT